MLGPELHTGPHTTPHTTLVQCTCTTSLLVARKTNLPLPETKPALYLFISCLCPACGCPSIMQLICLNTWSSPCWALCGPTQLGSLVACGCKSQQELSLHHQQLTTVTRSVSDIKPDLEAPNLMWGAVKKVQLRHKFWNLNPLWTMKSIIMSHAFYYNLMPARMCKSDFHIEREIV